MRALLVPLALLLVGCEGGDALGDGQERHGGLTLEEAKTQAREDNACPGQPTPNITRCEPRDDAWRCFFSGDGKTTGAGYSTVEKTAPDAETARLC